VLDLSQGSDATNLLVEVLGGELALQLLLPLDEPFLLGDGGCKGMLKS
jgi:hypothetical protein